MTLENVVQEPTGNAFIKKYNLGKPSTVRKSLRALIDKELVYDNQQEGKTTYEMYDVFLL